MYYWISHKHAAVRRSFVQVESLRAHLKSTLWTTLYPPNPPSSISQIFNPIPHAMKQPPNSQHNTPFSLSRHHLIQQSQTQAHQLGQYCYFLTICKNAKPTNLSVGRLDESKPFLETVWYCHKIDNSIFFITFCVSGSTPMHTVLSHYHPSSSVLGKDD